MAGETLGDPEFDPRHANNATSGRHKQMSSLCKGLCQEGQPDTNLGQTNLPLNLIFCSELWREQQEGKEEEVQALLLTKYLQQPKRVSRLAGVTDHMLPSLSGAGLKLMKLISHCGTRSRRCIFLYFIFFFDWSLCCWCSSVFVMLQIGWSRCLWSPVFWKSLVFHHQPGRKSKNATNSTYNCECRFAENTSAAVVIEVTADTAVEWRGTVHPAQW